MVTARIIHLGDIPSCPKELKWLVVERLTRWFSQAGERRLVAVAMYARISTLEGSPEQIDEGLDYVRENILPQIQQHEGFKGMIALADRETGKTLGLTFWESEDALRASEEAADKLREDSAEAMRDTIAAVERYEVGFSVMSS